MEFSIFISSSDLEFVSLYIIFTQRLCAGLQDLAVHVVLGVEKVGITGGHHGLAVLLTQSNHFAVEVTKLLLVLELPFLNEEAVVADGLDLQVVVELDDLGNIRVGAVVDDGPHQFSRLAGRAYDETLAVLFQHGFGNTRKTLEIIQIAFGNQLVKILQSRLILDQNDLVVGTANTPISQMGKVSSRKGQ